MRNDLKNMKKFNLVVAGGTFDYFHKGHEEFLRFILSQTERLLLGITSNSFVQGKVSDSLIESFEIRKKAVENFLQQENLLKRVEIAQIDSIYIPKIWEGLPIEAIFVSENTVQGADAINNLRVKEDLPALKIISCPLVRGEDGEFISSSRIRMGKINREGRPYISSVFTKNTLIITDSLTRELKKPFGFLINDFDSWIKHNKQISSQLVTVGDVVTKSANELSVQNNLSIIDFKIERKKVFSQIIDLGFKGSEKVVSVNNPSGSLTPELFSSVIQVFDSKSSKSRKIILVNGEEDLAVLPVLLAAPLGFTVLYGQPKEGVVLIEVTEEVKDKAYDIIGRFIAQ